MESLSERKEATEKFRPRKATENFSQVLWTCTFETDKRLSKCALAQQGASVFPQKIQRFQPLPKRDGQTVEWRNQNQFDCSTDSRRVWKNGRKPTPAIPIGWQLFPNEKGGLATRSPDWGDGQREASIGVTGYYAAVRDSDKVAN